MAVTAAGARPLPAERPVSDLSGIGPKLAERLARLGIHRATDLLFHLPLRYEDRTRVTPIGALNAGRHCLIEGVVEHAEVAQRRRRMLLARVADGTGAITLRFFHFVAAQKQALTPGARVRCFGEIKLGGVTLEMHHPEFKQLRDGEDVPVDDRLTPIYPSTEGLPQNRLRRLIDGLLAEVDALPECLPETLRAAEDFPTLAEALRGVHRPSPGDDLAALETGTSPASRRLIFEELLAHQLGMRQRREQVRAAEALRLPSSNPLTEQLLSALPFTLTAAQQRVVNDIGQDLQSGKPMLRLVQGDVGSGKTAVAACAAAAVIHAGHQVALMAPTELLAEQHLQTLRAWFEPLGVDVLMLSGRLRAPERLAAQARAREASLVIGTHALIQDGVDFDRLGLVIIDEQHRFGVQQRLTLRDKSGGGMQPHQLVMSATPIPRTLAMTVYADLDVSVIDELPPGRTPVNTVVIANRRRDEVIERIRVACGAGRQAYWVCTLIEESEALEAQAAEVIAEQLRAQLQELGVGLIHGRMKPVEKDELMRRFRDTELQLLVATTVIEVGVDVPNASLMVIENAERLGLSQLHQLRGRVGRGSERSHCVLMYQEPLGGLASKRLTAMRETTDGFEIARRDLELRGPGELLGTRQTGQAQFRVADLVRDQHLVPDVQRCADAMLRDDPQATQTIMTRWIGRSERYLDV